MSVPDVTFDKKLKQLQRQINQLILLGSQSPDVTSLVERSLESVMMELRTTEENAARLQFWNALADVNKEIQDITDEKARRELLTTIARRVRQVLEADIVTLYETTDEGQSVLPRPGLAGDFKYPEAMETRMRPSDIVFELIKFKTPYYTQTSQEEVLLLTERPPDEADNRFRFVVREGIQSTAAVPLIIRDETVGVLFVNFREKQLFDGLRKREIEALAAQVAVSVQNLHLVRQQIRAREDLAVLLSNFQQIASLTTDRASMLKEIIKQAVELIGVTRGAIATWEGGVGTVVVEYQKDDSSSSLGLTLGTDTPLQQKLHRGEVVAINDVPNSDVLLEDEKVIFLDLSIKSILVAPAMVENRVVATIGVNETRFPRPFTQREIHLIQALANQAGIALELAEKLDLTAVRQIIETALSRSSDIDETIKLILDRGLALIKAETGQLLLVEGDELVIRASTNPGDLGRRLPINDCVSGKAVLERAPVNVSDVTQPPYDKLYKRLLGQEIYSELVVPLITEDEIVGVLNAESKEKDAFSRREENLWGLLAGQAATAIQLARSFSEEATLREIQQEIIAQSSDFRQTIDLILRRGLKLIGAETGQLLLVEGEELRISASTQDEDIDKRVRIDDSVVGIAVQRQESVNVGDVTQEEPFMSVYKPFFGPAMKSELVVPLISDGEVIGALNAESPLSRAFTSRNLSLWELLAAQAVTVIRLAQGLEEQNALLEIQEITLNRAFEYSEVVQTILDKALQLVKANLGQLLLVEGEEAVIQASTLQDVGRRLRIDDSIVGLAVQEKRTVNIGDVTVKPYSDLYKWFGDKSEQNLSELTIPLILDDEVIGALNVESRRRNAFAPSQERLLTSLAGQIATALHLARGVQEQETLREIQQDLTSASFNFERAINLILERGLELIQAETGQLLLVRGKKLVIRASSNNQDIGKEVDIDDSVTGLAVLRRAPVNVGDVTTEEPYKMLYKSFLGPIVKSEMVVPLEADGQVIGVLNAESPRQNAFYRRHVELWLLLASQTTAAIRLAEQIEVEREKEKLAAVGELSGDMVHRLNNPMGAIRAIVQIIKERMLEVKTIGEKEEVEVEIYKETIQKFLTFMDSRLDMIARDAERVLLMVRELKASDRRELESTNAWMAMEKALARMGDLPERITITKKTGDSLDPVRANEKLADIFYNLIANAVEAMGTDGGRIELQAEQPSAIEVILSVCDGGVGIPPEQISEIFELYYSTKDREGRGLGLWWCKAYVERCGGSIRVESKVGQGTCFHVHLPVMKK